MIISRRRGTGCPLPAAAERVATSGRFGCHRDKPAPAGKPATNARWRVAAGAALACAAIALPAAAWAAPAANRPAHSATTAAPRCRAASSSGTTTVAWMGLPGDGYAGGVLYQLEFSNIGLHTCTLRDYPQVVAIANGHQAGLPAGHGPGTPPLVTLRPGATAHAVLNVHDAGALCPPTTATALSVTPPGQAIAWTPPVTVQVCRHRPTMDVAPVRSGTGVPFHTIR